MDPALRGLPGRVQAPEHGVGNPNSDSNFRTRKRLKNKWVSVKKLHSGDIVVLQELHHPGRWQGVGSGRTPVETDGSSPGSGGENAKEKDQTQIWRHYFGVVSLRILVRICVCLGFFVGYETPGSHLGWVLSIGSWPLQFRHSI